MSWSWTERGLDQLASLCRDVERMNTMSTTTKPGGIPSFTHAPQQEHEPIMPRTRINMKRLANGEWQPDYTCESFDADPLTDEGRHRIRARMMAIQAIVDDLIAQRKETQH